VRFEFDDLVAVMARLRGPDGCPWDREQTHASLAPYLLEETYEVLETISRGDPDALRGELGDLLLQVVFHAQMADEAGTFDVGAVVDGLVRKLLARHPHVFGDLRLETADAVLQTWHELKRREAPERGILEGIPAALPALARAQKLLGRAGRAGEGQTPADPARAAHAARGALEQAAARLAGPADPGAAAATIGSTGRVEAVGALLLAVVALAAAGGVDAESALREACDRFVAQHTSPV
jgi:MazG family protein